MARSVHMRVGQRQSMTHKNNKSRPSKSLYTMVARAEHAEGIGYEGAVYVLLISSGVFAILQAAYQAM